jgi:predicted nucleic acid-binding protein
MERNNANEATMNNFEVLIDSDAFIAKLYEYDLLHTPALELFDNLEQNRKLLVTTDAVVGETATVLSHRVGQKLATAFLVFIERSAIPIIHIDEKLHKDALKIFREQTQRGTSFVDCANVAVMKRFGIPTIFSFDEFYFKKLHLKQAA